MTRIRQSDSVPKPSDIKSILKTILARMPYGNGLLQLHRRYKERRAFTQFKDAQDLFTHYYRTNRWNITETVSGTGSTLAYTETLRKQLPDLLKQFAVKRLLDAPCGDYNWFRLIPRERDVHYIGGDIVQPLVENNQATYGNDNTTFISLDITKDRLPHVELWLCRDCLFHLSNKDIFKAIGNFLRSDIQYLLTSIHTECGRNRNVPTGSFRLLNLCAPPFGFCEPILFLDDWVEGYPVRQLGLWDREMLADALASNRIIRRAANWRRAA